MNLLIFLYGLCAYGVFFGWFLYTIGFVANAVVSKTVNTGVETPVVLAIVINILLVAAFGVQHTIMARPAFKRAIMRVIPSAMERSTFVWAAGILAWLIIWQWRPIPTVLWDLTMYPWSIALTVISLAGWGLVLLSSFMIDHFELFGLRHVWENLIGHAQTRPAFQLRGPYKFVRHPLMLGFLIAFWVTPYMTVGHLVLAVSFTVYILVGIRFEEKDLLTHHGEDYKRYQRNVSMLFPGIK